MKTNYQNIFLQIARGNTQVFGRQMKEIRTEFNNTAFSLDSFYELEGNIHEIQHIIPWSSVIYLEITEGKLFRIMLR
ncbi:MAG: hypothetical protein ACFFAE_15810 [Candidatus Hodarchaeota archaeon]